MEANQNSQTLGEQDEVQEDDLESIKIRVAIFFDGTLNNRTNIDQRLLSQPDNKLTKEERIAAKDLEIRTSQNDKDNASVLYKKHGADDDDESNSYEGYYTNIAIMEKYVDSSDKYDINLQTYIEGSGTIDKEGDRNLGYIFGTSTTGIPKKVEMGIFNIINLISENHGDSSIVISEITIDVFGFSRGAAAARNFVHEVLDGEKSIRKKLIGKNYKVNSGAVSVCFVGLYDTVSTYGFWKMLTDLGEANTKTLKLDAIARAKQVIQLAAADEHREYFSLTDINSARGKGRQIFLPGVHSDIGGGYRNNTSEKEVIYKASGYSLEDAEIELNSQIESGWFRKDEIKLEYELGYEGDEGDDTSIISVNRKEISNKYSRIPLKLMADFAVENDVKLKSKLYVVEKIPAELNEVKAKIDQYIDKTSKSEAQHWWSNNDKWLKDLRHDYFHYSARSKIGHNPRYYEGKRRRLILQG